MKKRVTVRTSTPDPPPPKLHCPTCDAPLTYRETVFSAMNPPERWDKFSCRACGEFEYRHRTRRLRPTV